MYPPPFIAASCMKTWFVKIGDEKFKCPAHSSDLKPTKHILEWIGTLIANQAFLPKVINAMSNEKRVEVITAARDGVSPF